MSEAQGPVTYFGAITVEPIAPDAVRVTIRNPQTGAPLQTVTATTGGGVNVGSPQTGNI